MASLGCRNVARIWGVNAEPGGKIALMAGARGCVFEGPQVGAATVRAAKARMANFIGAIVTI